MISMNAAAAQSSSLNGHESYKLTLLTSFCVVAVRSVVAGAEALPMMHHHSREFVEEVLGAWRACSAGAAGTRHAFG